jgi:5'(3')-deoxyribonucleotidase
VLPDEHTTVGIRLEPVTRRLRPNGDGDTGRPHARAGIEPSFESQGRRQQGVELEAVLGDVRFVFGVDLDGVCFDFYGSIREHAARWMGRPIDELTPDFKYGFEDWGIADYGGYPELHKYLLDHRYFAETPPLANVPQVLRRLSDAEIHIRIITHRLFISGAHEQAVAQTVEWLDTFEIPYRDLCFVEDKPAVGADLYIEDTDRNIIALRAAGNPTIAFGNVTNVGFPGVRLDDWLEVEAVVMAEHERWRQNREADTKFLALPQQ